jgi:hypothetical protein
VTDLNPCCGGTGQHGEGTGNSYCDECGAEFTAFGGPEAPGPCIDIKTLAAKRIEALKELEAARAENERLRTKWADTMGEEFVTVVKERDEARAEAKDHVDCPLRIEKAISKYNDARDEVARLTRANGALLRRVGYLRGVLFNFRLEGSETAHDALRVFAELEAQDLAPPDESKGSK